MASHGPPDMEFPLMEESDLSIPYSNLHIQRRLDSGGCGTVFKAEHKRWGYKVAYKEMTINYLNTESRAAQRLVQEAMHLKKLRHERVVQLMGIVWEDGHYGLLLPYFAHGSLDAFLGRHHPVAALAKLNFVQDIVLGMTYLHMRTPAVVHCDLKIGNILVDNALEMKVADFGISEWRTMQQTQLLRAEGTGTHIPPEKWADIHLKPKESYDVYAFAVLLWEIFTEEVPFRGASVAVIQGCVQQGQRPDRQRLAESCAELDGLATLVERCWSQDPQDRPRFTEIKDELSQLTKPHIRDMQNARSLLIRKIHTVPDDHVLDSGRGTMLSPEPAGQYSSPPSAARQAPLLSPPQPRIAQERLQGAPAHKPQPAPPAASREDSKEPTAPAGSPPMVKPALSQPEDQPMNTHKEASCNEFSIGQGCPPLPMDAAVHIKMPVQRNTTDEVSPPVAGSGLSQQQQHSTPLKGEVAVREPSEHVMQGLDQGCEGGDDTPFDISKYVVPREDVRPCPVDGEDVGDNDTMLKGVQECEGGDDTPVDISKYIVPREDVGHCPVDGEDDGDNDTKLKGVQETEDGERNPHDITQFVVTKGDEACSADRKKCSGNEDETAISEASGLEQPPVRTPSLPQFINPTESEACETRLVHPRRMVSHQESLARDGSLSYTEPEAVAQDSISPLVSRNNPTTALPVTRTHTDFINLHANTEHPPPAPTKPDQGKSTQAAASKPTVKPDQGKSGSSRNAESMRDEFHVDPEHELKGKGGGHESRHLGSGDASRQELAFPSPPGSFSLTSGSTEKVQTAPAQRPQNVHLGHVSGVQIGDGNHMHVRAGGQQTGRQKQRKQKKKVIKYITDSPAVLDNGNIRLMAQHVGLAWRALGRQLGFIEGELDALQHDHHMYGLQEIIIKMLCQWRERAAMAASLNHLATALINIGRPDVAARLQDSARSAAPH